MVYTESALQPGTYSLSITGANVFVTGVTPDHAGNGADMTLTLSGLGFDGSTTVNLVSSSNAIFPAHSVHVDLPTQLTVAFTAGSVPAGTYTVQVNNLAGTSTLAGAFQVVTGGQAKLVTNVVVPSAVGRHVASTLMVEYRNDGDVAMPAPLLVLTATQNGKSVLS